MRHSTTQLLDRDYVLDVAAFQADFANVNIHDPDQLRRWFQTHPYLSAADHARIADVAVSTIYRWRSRVGAGPGRTRPMARPPRRQRQDPIAPPDWKHSSWLEDNYGTYSIPQLARAIGRSYVATRRHLKRRLSQVGRQLRDKREAVRSTHPCCTRAWLLRHYVVAGLSVQRCADMAGVSRLTMMCWLARYKIRIRSNSEQQLLYHGAMAQTIARPPQ